MSNMAIAVHKSHKLEVDISDKDGRLFDRCSVCFECACHSPAALQTECDDISWVFATSTSN